MKPYLPDSEKLKIDEDLPRAADTLTRYLKTKYGYQESDVEIIANEPETNMFALEGSEIKQKEIINYTGHFVATVKAEEQEINVRYSPKCSTAFYRSGGADNKQTAALQEDIQEALSAKLPYAAGIIVKSGSLLPRHDGLLDRIYDGSDWFSPIPLDGFCFIQLLIFEDTVALSTAENDLARFFSSREVSGVYICANIRYVNRSWKAASPSGWTASDLMPFGNTSTSESRIWENVERDYSAIPQRL